VSLFFRFLLFSSFAVTLAAQSGDDVVTVEELRNPLTGKSLRMILTAQQHLRSGQHERGMQELREALKDPVAMPYALSMLGAEHLKAGQLDPALSELEQAIQSLPRAEIRSNLAYALYLKGQTERGLEEARTAFKLDGGKPKTRLVLGLLLLQQGSHEAEAIHQLEVASQGSPDAHLILARHYDRAGKAPEAEKERRAYAITSMSLFASK